MNLDNELLEKAAFDPTARALVLQLEEADLPLYTTLRLLEPWTSVQYEDTDAGNSLLFADLFGDSARHVGDRNCWYVYEKGVWKPDPNGRAVNEKAKLLARLMHLHSLDQVGRSGRLAARRLDRLYSNAGRRTLLSDAAGIYELKADDFDADPWLLNCQNGVLDLRTGQFRQHRSGDLMTRMAQVSYDPDAHCPRWEQFMHQVMQSPGTRQLAMGEDAEDPAAQKAAYLQRAMGYALTGDTREECLFILYGASTRNGKGTMMETFMRLMGDYARAAQPSTIGLQPFGHNASAPSEDLARLQGARFVSVAEPDRNLTLSAALLKQMTGNDTITARYLHENSFEYHPQFKLFINTNHLPRVNDLTLFQSGRIRLVPFERHFEENEQDKTLKDFFARPENLSGILNWCLDGLKAYLQDGLGEPAPVRRATARYQRENDRVARFMEECLMPSAGARTRTSQVYARYRQWCEDNGERPETSQLFLRALAQKASVTRLRPDSQSAKTTVLMDYQL